MRKSLTFGLLFLVALSAVTSKAARAQVNEIESILWSNDQSTIVVQYANSQIEIVDLIANQTRTISPAIESVSFVTLRPDGTQLAIIGDRAQYSSNIIVMNTTTLTSDFQFVIPGEVTDVVYDSQGLQMGVSYVRVNGVIQLYETSSYTLVEQYGGIGDRANQIEIVDEDFVLVRSRGYVENDRRTSFIGRLDRSDGAFEVIEADAVSMHRSSVSNLLAFSILNEVYVIYGLPSTDIRSVPIVHSGYIALLGWHPFGQSILFQSDTGIYATNIETGQQIDIIAQPIDAVAVSPDGTQIAVSYESSGELTILPISIEIQCQLASCLETPTNLAIGDGMQPNLTWQDNSVDEDGFIVSRQIDGGDWQDIATLPADTITYTDVACGALAYRVRATRTSPLPLDSIPSNEVSVSVSCNEPTLSTHTAGAATGPTSAFGSCSAINVTVQADYVDQVEHASTFRIEDATGNVYRQTETTIDPTVLNPRLGNSVLLNYGLMVQGGDPNNHNAAPTPLPATTYWRWRVENSSTGACQRIVVEVDCITGVATITENTSTCELPPAGPLVPPPPPLGGGGSASE